MYLRVCCSSSFWDGGGLLRTKSFTTTQENRQKFLTLLPPEDSAYIASPSWLENMSGGAPCVRALQSLHHTPKPLYTLGGVSNATFGASQRGVSQQPISKLTSKKKNFVY